MNTPATETPAVTPDVFRPSTGRAWLTVVVAAGAFFIPQEIPLEWYPLNNPSSGLQYLEITCKANVTGTAEIFLDTGRGYNELEKISWPIGPSEMAYTYTFPLADAPLSRLRLDGVLHNPEESTITNFRIINRRDEEICRYIGHSPSMQTTAKATTSPTTKWHLSMTNVAEQQVDLQSSRPLIAEGMNERNLKRCLLSVSYLTLMLWILLLAVFFTFRHGGSLRVTLQAMSFLLLISFCFSFVGNRGLVGNSLRFARISSSNNLDSREGSEKFTTAPRAVLLEAEPVGGILGKGWYGRDGRDRWIGQRAGVTFQSGPEGKVIISGYLPDFLAPNVAKVSANGVLLATTTLHPGIYSIECHVDKNSLVCLCLELSKTVIPKKSGMNDDLRELGAIVTNISSN